MILIKIVGIIMVIALLTIPGAISRRYMKGLPGIMAGSIVLGAIFVTIGLLISYELDSAIRSNHHTDCCCGLFPEHSSVQIGDWWIVANE